MALQTLDSLVGNAGCTVGNRGACGLETPSDSMYMMQGLIHPPSSWAVGDNTKSNRVFTTAVDYIKGNCLSLTLSLTMIHSLTWAV